MYPILQFGSGEQKSRWLPLLQAGKAFGCFGLTEPDFGSNPAGMRTRAARDGSGWVLNGEKTWITNGSIADIAVIWARTGEGVQGFLIERGTPGFSATDVHDKWSMRASVTSSLSMTDCRVCRIPLFCRARRVTESRSRLSDAGAFRHWLGSDRRRYGLL